MDSIAQQPWPKKHGGRRHGHRPRSARVRTGEQKSAAQLRAGRGTARTQVRAELRLTQLLARSA